VHLQEKYGVRVYSLGLLTRSVDALSQWVGDVPFVFLNVSKSGERGRFDCAHELGHLIMHRHLGSSGRDAEREANDFASELLLPREEMYKSRRAHLSFAELLEMKRYWGVSASLLLKRWADLRLVTAWESRGLWRRLSTTGFRSSEPGGAPREHSQALTQVLQLLRRSGVGLRGIADALGWNPDDVVSLVAGLTPAVIERGVDVATNAGDEVDPAFEPARLHLLR